jgi:cellulose synthase operon protein C
MRDAISRIFGRIVALVREMSARRPVKKLPLRGDEATRASMLLLCVAGSWFYFGQNEQAAEVTGQVRRQLLEEELPPIQRTNLACAYVSAVGQASIETALPLIEELFQPRSDNSGQKNLHGVKDQQTTASQFSLSQLDVVEATVLALVSDEANLSPESRRWLDEDEFLVRRRIHRDVRAMTG